MDFSKEIPKEEDNKIEDIKENDHINKDINIEEIKEIVEIKKIEEIDEIKKIEEIEEIKKIEKPKIRTLCFSGGSIKGFAFIGALEKLLEKNIILLENIKCFIGTSAGSILCFLLNLGWNVKEIKDFVLDFNFTKLIGKINSITFFKDFGIQDGERLKLLFIKFLESKFKVKDITFQELYNLTKKKLIIIGTNLTKGEEVIFSYKTTPDFSVILALRISCSLPILFTPITYNNEVYVDGGIVNNFPIKYCSRKFTIGFYIKNNYSLEIDSIKTLIVKVLGLTADTISEKNIKKYKKNIIQIKNVKMKIMDFNIDRVSREKIIELGYISAEEYLNNLEI